MLRIVLGLLMAFAGAVVVFADDSNEAFYNRSGPFQIDGLYNRTGAYAGGYGQYYAYREPSLGVSLKGPALGVMAGATFNRGNAYVRLEGDGSLGSSSYHGSGSDPRNPTWKAEFRALVGYDVTLNDTNVISPFIGYGSRYHYDDDRGTSSSGYSGYRRDNQLQYAPLGVEWNTALFSSGVLSFSTEYDAVLSGRQKSHLDDADPLYGTMTNRQSSGWGTRNSLALRLDNNELGLFYQVWHIDTSDVAVDTSGNFVGREPANHTTETGLYYRRHFAL
jgi:hypothetical protein